MFPKWTYNPVVSRPTSITRSANFVSMETIEEEDEEKEGAAFAMFDWNKNLLIPVIWICSWRINSVENDTVQIKV